MPDSLSESAIQKSIIAMMRKTNAHRRGWTFFHCPNDGRNGKGYRIHAYQMGQLAGVPDIVIAGPDGLIRFIEVKAAKGRLSEHQEGFRLHCERYGLPWALVRSCGDAIDVLEGWGFFNRNQEKAQ